MMMKSVDGGSISSSNSGRPSKRRMLFNSITGQYIGAVNSNNISSEQSDQHSATSDLLNSGILSYPSLHDQEKSRVNVPLPSFEDWLGIPLNFIVSNVKNSGEAQTIFEIGCIGAEIDAALTHLQEQLLDRSRLEEMIELLRNTPTSAANVTSSSIMLSTPKLCVLEQAWDVNERSLMSLMKTTEGLFKSLASLTASLERYMEINNSTSQELLLAGCEPLANQKQLIAKTERKLLHRAESLFREKKICVKNMKVADSKYICWENDSDGTGNDFLEPIISPILPVFSQNHQQDLFVSQGNSQANVSVALCASISEFRGGNTLFSVDDTSDTTASLASQTAASQILKQLGESTSVVDKENTPTAEGESSDKHESGSSTESIPTKNSSSGNSSSTTATASQEGLQLSSD